MAADGTFGEVIDEAIRMREELEAWIARAGSIDAAIAELSGLLGVAPDQSIAAIETMIESGPIFPTIAWAPASEQLAEGLVSDRKLAQTLTAALASSGDTRIDLYLQAFFTDKLEPRKQIVTKTIEQNYPDLADRLKREGGRLVDLAVRRRAAKARERTRALVTVADALIRRYRAGSAVTC